MFQKLKNLEFLVLNRLKEILFFAKIKIWVLKDRKSHNFLLATENSLSNHV